MLWGIVLAILVPSCIAGVKNGLAGCHDFSWFYADARYLITGGDLTAYIGLEWYLPGFRVLISPLGLMTNRGAVLVWNALNLVALVAVVCGIARCARTGSPEAGDEGHARTAAAAAFLLGAPTVFVVFQVNQISLWPLALLVWAHIRATERRYWVAGLLLGLAVFVKLLPALLLVWCLLRRRVTMAVCAVALPVVLSFGADAAVHGSSAAWRHHVYWYRVAVTGSAGTRVLERGRELSHRNQGLPGVLGRLLQPTPAANAKPFSWSQPRRVRPVNIASLNTSTVKAIYALVVVVSLAGLIAASIRAGRRPGPLAEHGLFALWCMAILWFAPLMRQYYLVWALPALWVLVDRAGRHGRAKTSGAVCLMALVAWAIGLAGWAIPEFRAVGVNQWVNLVVMAALVWELGSDAGASAKSETRSFTRDGQSRAR